jgi:hypothetical protein
MNKNENFLGQPKRYGKSQFGVNDIKSFTDALGINLASIVSPQKSLLRTEKIILRLYTEYNGDIPKIAKEMKKTELFVNNFVADLKKKGYIKD